MDVETEDDKRFKEKWINDDKLIIAKKKLLNEDLAKETDVDKKKIIENEIKSLQQKKDKERNKEV